MTNPGDRGLLAARALEQMSPLFAWAREYQEGLLVVSRLACESYGIKPIEPVKPVSEVDLTDRTEIAKHIPRTNVTVVGPAEAEQLLDSTGMHDKKTEATHHLFAGIEDGRIDVIMGFLTTLHDTPEKQETFFESAYEASEWPAVQQRNTSEAYPYRLSHLIADLTAKALEKTVPMYHERLGLRQSPNLTSYYATNVSSSIHFVFCEDEHLPAIGIPEAI